MCPNAALRRLDDAIQAGDKAEQRHAKLALSLWLSRGGFEPDWLCFPVAAAAWWRQREVVRVAELRGKALLNA